jgi:serine/threonine protein kinase
MTTPGLPSPIRYIFKPYYLKPGTRIGAYLIQDAIGHGGGQMAYLAYGPDERRVVLKMSLCPKGEPGTYRRQMHERFQRQVTYFLQLHDVPGVAAVLGHDMYPDRSPQGYFYMVQEWVQGELNILQWSRSEPHPLRVLIAGWMILANACGEMDRRGICHRDLKPENILVTPRGVPKIIDFNSGFSVGAVPLTVESATQVPGTPSYYSPEHCRAILTQWNTGEARMFQARPEADLHALGVIFYEALTGEHPFDVDAPEDELFQQIAYETPERPSALNPEVPFGMEKVTMRLLQKDPEDRYPSGDELVKDLEALLTTREDWDRPFQTPTRDRHSTATTSRPWTSHTSTRLGPYMPRSTSGAVALDLAPSAIVLAGPRSLAVRGPQALLRLEPEPATANDAEPPPVAPEVVLALMDWVPAPRPRIRRPQALLLLAACLALALMVPLRSLGQHEGAGSFFERGATLLGKAKAAVVAAASVVLAACPALTGKVRADDKEWLRTKCPEEGRETARSFGVRSSAAFLDAGPNVLLHDRGVEVRAGPVEAEALLSTTAEGIPVQLFGEIRTGTDGASVRFTHLKRVADGQELPFCAIAAVGDGPGIPKAEIPPFPPASELHSGFVLVTTREFWVDISP